MSDRWDENEIIESQVGESRYGLKRLADTFPGLTDEEKERAREDVRENVRPLFVYCSLGLSDRTHGFLFMVERGGLKISQRTWAKARNKEYNGSDNLTKGDGVRLNRSRELMTPGCREAPGVFFV